jgi:hypothetical protein
LLALALPLLVRDLPWKELRASSFSDFVRHTVLATASKSYPIATAITTTAASAKKKEGRTNGDETRTGRSCHYTCTCTFIPPTPYQACRVTPERARRSNTPEDIRVDKVEKIHGKEEDKTKHRTTVKSRRKNGRKYGQVSLPVSFGQRGLQDEGLPVSVASWIN